MRHAILFLRQNRNLFIAALLLVWFLPVKAADRLGYSLVCFEESGLESVLDTVVDMTQVMQKNIAFDVYNKQHCSYVKIPSDSTASFSQFYETKNGFIFPVYQVTLGGIDQPVFGFDAVFPKQYWRVETGQKKCDSGLSVCLVPNTCLALGGFPGKLPVYVSVPRECRAITITLLDLHHRFYP